MLDFVTDPEMNQALGTLDQGQLRMLILNARMADRLDGERIKSALDRTWKQKFPKQEAPWPKAVESTGLNVAGMSVGDRLAEAIRRSEKYGGDEIKGKLAELLTPESLAFMAGTIILFAVLEGATAGGAGLALVVLSAALVGPEVYRIVGDINGFITTSIGAKDETDLDVAGQYFAKAAVAISIDILVAVLLHKPAKAATPKIQAGAKAVGEFLKPPSGGGPPTGGGLVPALVMGPDVPPRFVNAPPERLAPPVMESRGGGLAELPKVMADTVKRIKTVEQMLERRPKIRTQFEGEARSLRTKQLKLENDYKNMTPDAADRSGGMTGLAAVEESMAIERQAADMIRRIEAADKGGAPAGAFDNAAFVERIRHLSPNDRVALVEQTAGTIAQQRGWRYESQLSSTNNRSVYRDVTADKLYGVDTQHGTFERCASTGKHEAEVNFVFEQTDGPSADHSLKVR